MSADPFSPATPFGPSRSTPARPPHGGFPRRCFAKARDKCRESPPPVRDFVKRNGDLYFRLYVPINWPCARTCPSIARRSSFFVAPGLRLSSVSSAQSLKK